MAIGKNKRLTKSKKGSKKKAVDPFTRKETYNVKAPSMFATRNAGRTIITKTTGQKIASEGLKGRVFEISLADLNGGDESQGYRKVKLVCEDVNGFDVLTNFHGMDMTRDKLCSLIRKWQTLIEAFVDVRTTDGYYLRLFCIGFTKKQSNQQAKSTCYAQSGQVRAIRRKMFDIMTEEASKCDLKELVQKLCHPHMMIPLFAMNCRKKSVFRNLVVNFMNYKGPKTPYIFSPHFSKSHSYFIVVSPCQNQLD